MAKFETLATIVSDAAIELGLGAVSDVVASTDRNIQQLRTLLKRTGRRLALHRGWTSLRGRCELATSDGIATVDGELAFRLPVDFLDMIQQSGWNRTTQQALHSQSAQQWQTSIASASGGVITATFRPFENIVAFYPAPAASEVVVFEYRSRYWVSGETFGRWMVAAPSGEWDVGVTVAVGGQLFVEGAPRRNYICTTGGTTGATAPTSTGSAIVDGTVVWAYINDDVADGTFPSLDAEGNVLLATADEPTANTDVLLLESSLLVAALKLEFLKAKGFDTTAAQQDYDEALRLAEAVDVSAAPVLCVTPGGAASANIPETGFGA